MSETAVGQAEYFETTMPNAKLTASQASG